jgi:hypothetical protein
LKNEPKTNPKGTRNEAKLEAKKSKNSAICAKRSEAPQSKEAGLNEPQGGYMSGDPGMGDASPGPGNRHLILGSRHLIPWSVDNGRRGRATACRPRQPTDRASPPTAPGCSPVGCRSAWPRAGRSFTRVIDGSGPVCPMNGLDKYHDFG